MKNRIVFAFAIILSASIFFLNACRKEEINDSIFEPITIQKPDTLAVRLFPGDSLPIQIAFTTDRPINWVKGMYDIDSLFPAGYVATFPDTLFFIKLDTVLPRNNRYTYNGLYRVPDTLRAYSVVRFKISMEADTLHYSKQFKINVR